jgi:sec-independent protein translocase protein TatC
MDGQVIEGQLTFAGHINELRRRLSWPALILVAGAGMGYVFHDAIIRFLQAPLHQTLYYNTPAGGFNFIMKVCFILGITLAIPVLIYNIISFIEPAVEKKITRRIITMVTALSLTLGLAGAAFAYFVVLPVSLKFFGNVNISGVKPLIAADDYLNFALTCIVSFILLFQIPLLVLFINHIKPMSPRKLLKYEKHVIVGSLVIALVLPFTYDPLTQFLIALPIVILYNLSVMMVWMANRERRKERKQRAATAQTEALLEPQPKLVPLLPPAPVVVQATIPMSQKPTAIRQTFMEPVVGKPMKRAPVAVKRPMLDVVAGPMRSQNFLDLRLNK